MTEPRETAETGEIGRRERKKQATRRHIAGTAVRLFLERGFEEVSVAEIAEAADVSKVTVFNYFPAKADMVFELGEAALADPAGAVRARAPGQTPLRAIREYYFDALARRLEWTCLHDGVQPYARMMWASPTLLAAFAVRAMQSEDALAVELARASGETPWDLTPWSDLDHVDAPGAIGHRLVASMISHVLGELVRANVGRMLAGQSADEAEPQALADAELAFGLLETGAARFGAR
jgi:AcrR family transcriptional regulator